jgi:hypothetical protein
MRRIKPLKAFYLLRISARENVPRVPYPKNTGEMVVSKMGQPKPDILPPMEGVSYLMDETYLSNLRDGKPPFGELVELVIFVERYIGKQKKRCVCEFTGATEQAALAKLEEFASRSDVTLVEEKSRKPVPKQWLEKESA